MAKFSLNFPAVAGTCKIGYRTYNDPINTYVVIEHNVVVAGIQTITIEVPGSLYCASEGIEYTGYVLPECLSDVDTGRNGIPDAATTWSVQLNKQNDECLRAEIHCDYLSLNTNNVHILAAGISCAPDGEHPITISTPNPADTIENGIMTATLLGGSVIALNIINPGKYLDNPDIAVSGVTCDTDSALQARLGPKGTVIDLKDFACKGTLNLNGSNSLYAIALGEHIVIYTTAAKIANLPAEYVAQGMASNPTARCTDCRQEVIDVAVPSAATGVGRIIYQTCWDGSNAAGAVTLITDKLLFGVTLDIGCVLEDTVKIEQGTLAVLPTKTISNCV